MNILVAEDENDIRELIASALESDDYNIYTAENGVKALKIFNEVDIDLLVLDVIMPYLDGFNLLKKIREKSNVPAIFLTARGEEMDKILGLGLGADDYIVKPFSFGELKARVDAQIRRNYSYKNDSNEKETEKVIESKDIRIVENECTAYKGDEVLELSTKEYMLLKLFMSNPGRVFTKKQIYSAVWKDEFISDDNTVMVHLSHLRSKLEGKDSDKKVSYISTLKGIGYKWNKN